MSKVKFGGTQPNPKESKVWLHPHNGLKTYNQKKQEWTGGTSKEESKTLKFTIMAWDGEKDIPFEFDYVKGMNWDDWFNSEYNVIPFLRNDHVDLSDNISIWTDENASAPWDTYVYGALICNYENGDWIYWENKIEPIMYAVSIIG